MKDNNFVYADLSTFDVEKTKSFYSKLFNWSYFTDNQSYYVAYANDREVCGMYEMPEKFKAINMPSFWMSYIQVSNLESTLEKVKSHNGIIELIDTNQSIGKIALVRDSLGAGFTLYEGSALNSRFQKTHNTMVWNELFISDLDKIKPFYEGIFNWTIQKSTHGRHLIKNQSQETIGAIQELSNSIKGNKEYWSVYFGVSDREYVKQTAVLEGGDVIYEDAENLVITDPNGAFFHILEL